MEKGKRQKAKGKTIIKNLKLFKLLLLSCGFAFLLFSFTLNCLAASVQQALKAGNNLYRQEKFDEALAKYNEASIAMPDSDIINFNTGAALYKKQDYQKAQDALTKALSTDDRKLEADALYNLGNCKYRFGKLKTNTDLSATVSLLRESLDYYKRAVELDQKNTDARFNHEFVERELKVLLDKLKQQQGEQKQKNEQSDQSRQQQEGEQKQEESAQAQEGQQEEKEEKSGQEESAISQEQAQESEEDRDLSEQEAAALLERYGREEAIPDYMDKRTRGYDREVLKDW